MHTIVDKKLVMLRPEEIKRSVNQPRREFDSYELELLAESISASGIIQPLAVRRCDDGKYELIAGERRLRASIMAGIRRIPCVIHKIDDQSSAVYSLIENLQRKNLNFFEEASGIERLITLYGMSQSEASVRLGMAQSTLSNKLRLLRLPEALRDKISCAGLTERHARALLQLPDNITRGRVRDIIIERHLTVAESERLISDVQRRKKSKNRPKMKAYKDMRIFLNTLNHAVDAIRKAGIEADTAKSETDEYFEYVIRISKPEDPTVATITTQAV